MDIPLMQMLKEGTRGKHTSAEEHPFQSALAQGKLPFLSYCKYLRYLYSLHDGFETRLAQEAARNGAIAAVVKPEHYQLQFLTVDITTVDEELPKMVQSNSVDRFLKTPVLASEPVSLLGVLYVLLGSKHGAKFIAHNVKEAYKFNGGGCLYFDPYGGEFRPLWQSFVSSMNELQLTESQRQSVLAAAGDTFDVFGDMGEEIWNSRN